MKYQISAFLVLLLTALDFAVAQPHSLQIEVLIQPSPTHRIFTQKWGQAFQKLGRTARFRGGENGERTRIEETEFRGRKSVLVVGIMNRSGTITFKDQTFNATQPQPLEDWLKRLEQFGAAGPADESPTWGLSTEQFTEVLKLLSEPVTDTVRLKTPMDAVDSLRLPFRLKIAFTDKGRTRAFPKFIHTEESTDVFKGLSKGSVLAATLAQFGLGFRPKVGPGDRYLVEIDVGDEDDNLYPIGWKNTKPIMTVVPALGKSIPVDLEDVDVEALVDVIAKRLDVAWYASNYALAVEGRKLSLMKFSRKPDKLPLQELLDILGSKLHVGFSLRTDEAGHVFLWITTPKDKEAFRKRFAHVRPAP